MLSLYMSVLRRSFREKTQTDRVQRWLGPVFSYPDRGGSVLMENMAVFLVKSVLLGVGLAMDAFSVSIANRLKEPEMSFSRQCAVAGVYAFFQYAMPMAGWFCIHSVLEYFQAFQVFIPWIALGLLGSIGGGMLKEGMGQCVLHSEEQEHISWGTLAAQGVATSIDALSVGFTIADYDLFSANAASMIIAAVTFGICMAGLLLGRVLRRFCANRAGILGGVILIGIGLEIFISGVFF